MASSTKVGRPYFLRAGNLDELHAPILELHLDVDRVQFLDTAVLSPTKRLVEI